MDYYFASHQLEPHETKFLAELNTLYEGSGHTTQIALAQYRRVLITLHPGLLLARDDGQLVGCGMISYIEGLVETVAIIHGVIVAASHRKRRLKRSIQRRLRKAANARDVFRVVIM